MSELTAAQTDKLLADLRLVVADAEALLTTTAGEAGAGAVELRVFRKAWRARDTLADAQETALAMPAPAAPPTTTCTTTCGARSASRPDSASSSAC